MINEFDIYSSVQHIQINVISIDATHLKSAYEGMIFIHSGLTGNDEAYILAFGISSGNEGYITCNIFNASFS